MSYVEENKYFISCEDDKVKGKTGSKVCITKSGKDANTRCVFPFRYDGIIYNSCTKAGNQPGETEHWCSTKVDSSGQHVSGQGKWGWCDTSCNIPSRTLVSTNQRTFKENTCSVTELNSGVVKPCKFPFNFKGETFYKCTTIIGTDDDGNFEHGDAWCSTNTDSNNNHILGGGFYGDCLRDNCPSGIE